MATASTSQSLPVSRPRLLPREHGACFQLGLPLATALAITGPGAAALWLTAAALACFLAHKPLLVVLGHRGARRREETGSLASRWGLTLAGLAAACGVLGILGLSSAARPYLALPVVLGAEVLLMTWGRQGRTLSCEVLAALALGACAVPVALAGDLAQGAALSMWGTFALGFSLATVAVHIVVRSHKSRAERNLLRLAGLLTGALGLAGAVGWAWSADVSSWRVAALLPTPALALGTCAMLPSPRHLKRLGWSFAATGLLTAVLLGAGLA